MNCFCRYLKRGVNDRGRVANDVETEQIVLDEESGSCKGKMSSVVQMRGSIPLFWSQEASRFSPKPDIILQRYDPTYQATKLHFEDLAKRYGNPIIVLNLIKVIPHIKIVSALTNMNLHVFFIPFPFFLCINELLLL
ncbi:Polyphosphoinositide phosphatase [Glycine soja]|uniref:Polyphosphoinositide phosphatase n=1 Tax=Glycine soja TaxID=3848 RepID=A0A0B2PTB0_GLYSO|nr:Polyphosphoinositide phosphatase [Glycine soja]